MLRQSILSDLNPLELNRAIVGASKALNQSFVLFMPLKRVFHALIVNVWMLIDDAAVQLDILLGNIFELRVFLLAPAIEFYVHRIWLFRLCAVDLNQFVQDVIILLLEFARVLVDSKRVVLIRKCLSRLDH